MSLSYKNFFDINDVSDAWQVENDFIGKMEKCLFNHSFPLADARAIASTTFHSMNRKLHYHTPVHVLHMLKFAEEHEVYPGFSEELVVWLHDAIYVPGRNDNEELSAMFAQSLLSPFLPSSTVKFITRGIRETAKYLQNEIDHDFALVLDLDLCGFLASNRYVINQALEKEISSLCENKKDYLEKRLKFLKNMLAKKFIYHSAFFVECFEDIARDNIHHDIRELENNEKRNS